MKFAGHKAYSNPFHPSSIRYKSICCNVWLYAWCMVGSWIMIYPFAFKTCYDTTSYSHCLTQGQTFPNEQRRTVIQPVLVFVLLQNFWIWIGQQLVFLFFFWFCCFCITGQPLMQILLLIDITGLCNTPQEEI